MLLQQKLGVQIYCLLVLLEPVAGVEVLPEPTPELLLAAPGVVGVLLAPLELELPGLPEDEPEPALLRSSRRQLSREAPVRPTHLLASLPDAPVDALPEVLLSDGLVVEDDEPVDGSVDDEDVPLEGDVVVLLPDEPVPEAPDDDEPMPEDAPVPLPALEPEDCANAAPDNASNAAAVAAVRVFNIMREISFEGWMNMLRGSACKARSSRAGREPGVVVPATPSAPRQEWNLRPFAHHLGKETPWNESRNRSK